MSLNSMIQRMIREVPGLSGGYAKTLLNEALVDIYDSQMWSWQLQTNGWLTPGLLFPAGPGVSVGTITAVPYTNTLVGDEVASAAWLAYITNNNRPFFPELQIRSPYYSLYNIISSVQTGGGYGEGGYGEGGYGEGAIEVTLTLDRPWMEPGGVLNYMIYQAYFAVPVSDFKRFRDARDTTNNAPMDYWTKTQKDLSVEDPERVVFDDPVYIVPQQVDHRPGSSTFGNMLYELWPHPLSVLPYTFGYLRQGPQLANPGDTVPYPLTEEAVLWKAKSSAYMYKEAQKGEQMQRGAGANWQFLAEAAEDKYKTKIKPVKTVDEDLVNLYMDKFRRDIFENSEPFATVNSQLNVGR